MEFVVVESFVVEYSLWDLLLRHRLLRNLCC